MDNSYQTNSNALESLKHSGGRPTTITETVIAKLIGAFQQGLSVKKACDYAQISVDAYYRKYKTDQEFRKEIDHAKAFLLTIASETITRVLLDPETPLAIQIRLSMWILERKDPEAFGTPEERMFYKRFNQSASELGNENEDAIAPIDDEQIEKEIAEPPLDVLPTHVLKPFKPYEIKELPTYKPINVLDITHPSELKE